MRLAPSARHALAAVALATLAAGSAPAADYYLTLKGVDGVTATAALESFSWGATQAAHGTGGNMGAQARTLSGLKSETETVEAKVGGGSGSSGGPGGGGSGGMGAGKVSYQDLSVMNASRKTGASDASAGKGAGGSDRVAVGDLNADGRADSAAGASGGAKFGAVGGMHRDDGVSAAAAAGKRQHSEVKITKTLDKSSPVGGRGAARPLLAKGGLRLAASLPGCAVGATYPAGTLEGGGMRYELKDVMITSCAAGQLGLNYAEVTVRGWDPAKK